MGQSYYEWEFALFEDDEPDGGGYWVFHTEALYATVHQSDQWCITIYNQFTDDEIISEPRASFEEAKERALPLMLLILEKWQAGIKRSMDEIK